jgi:hypothetical protein
MKALVVTNCATAAYTSGLRALFPDWEVKGAELNTARNWVGGEPNPSFIEFLASTDLVLTAMPDEPMFAGNAKLVVPAFHFRAYHPDSFHLSCGDVAIQSVLKSGNLHSRIAATAFLLGMSRNDAIAAFDAGTYERTGYFAVFEAEKTELLQRFALHGIDLAAAFDRWTQTGNFLYTYNHPKASIFSDVLLQALKARFIESRQMASARATLATVPDYLEPSIRWPVYPEIAALYRFDSEMVWRTGRDAGSVSMSLEDFVGRSFEVLQTLSDISADCIPGFAQCRDALQD